MRATEIIYQIVDYSASSRLFRWAITYVILW